jgi:flavodoxin
MQASTEGRRVRLFFADGDVAELVCSTEQVADCLAEKINDAVVNIAYDIGEELGSEHIRVH